MKKNFSILIGFLVASFFVSFYSPATAVLSNCVSDTGSDVSRSIKASNPVVACVFTESVDGVDGGSLTIGADTVLSIPSSRTVVFTTVTLLSSTSSITVSKNVPGGLMKKGFIYVTDTDADTVRLSNASDAVYSTLASNGVPGKVRRNATAPIVDGVGWDSNDAIGCPPVGTVAGHPTTCETCSNGAIVIASAGTDPSNTCTFAGWNGCLNNCVKTTTIGDFCAGTTARCQNNTDAAGKANVAAGKICSAGSEIAGACALGYTCQGDGTCCYTDIYGLHCI